MMQGITTLPGAQQGNQQAPQAPGQAAQFQAMPAKQGGIAPPITAPLEKLPPQQLLSMYNNPQDTTPKWAVATAYAKAVEQARLMQMAQGQSAMAQGQAQAQQPPVVQQVMSQPIPETQYAAHGGIMHGYAGGGAVAFNGGGPTPYGGRPLLPEKTGFEGMTLPEFAGALFEKAKQSIGSAEENAERRNRERAAKKRIEEMEPLMRSYVGRPSLSLPEMQFAYESAGMNATPAVIPESQKDTRQIPPSEVRASAPAGPVRLPSTGAAAPAGIAAVANQIALPPLDPYYAQQAKEAEELARSKAEMMKAQGIISPEVLASRQRLRQAQENAYAPQRKALEEAKAERDAGLFGNAEALGRMAAAVGGTKRFGQGLAAAAGAGSEVVARQRERIEKLGDRYNDLQAQLNITMAQAQHADVVGDDALKRKALADAEAIKMELFNTRNALRAAAQAQRTQETTGIAALRKAAADEMSARASMISAGKPTDFQQKLALYRADPNTYESMFGSKDAQLMTRVQQVTNTDPLLKQLASNAAMNLPGATEQYNARYRELIAMHAPELLIGTAPAAGGGARAAATDVVRKGQQ